MNEKSRYGKFKKLRVDVIMIPLGTIHAEYLVMCRL